MGNYFLVSGDTVYLIDFDNARRYRTISQHKINQNLLRLRRSMQKNLAKPEYFSLICEGYGEFSAPRWMSGLYRLRGWISDAASGRAID